MRDSWFKRMICLLLAVQCVISIPASDLIAAAAAEEAFGEEALSDPLAMEEGEALFAGSGEEELPEEPAPEEQVISWVDIEGNYNAPESVLVYVSRYLGESGGQLRAQENYTGVVAFYDYENDKSRLSPFFFYYKEGRLQTGEQFVTAQGWLDLSNPPVSASVLDNGASDPEARAYAGEEVYAEPGAETHSGYLFAFGQKGGENGLFSGQREGVTYIEGLAQTEPEGAEEPTEPTEPADPEPPARPEPVTPETGAAAKAEGVLVTWTGDGKAAGYRILRKGEQDADWTAVADLAGGGQESYLDTAAPGGKTWIYAVRSYYGQKPAGEWEAETDSLVWSGVSPSGKIFFLAAPEITNVYDANPGLTVKWTKVEGAERYRVYRRTLEDKGWTRIADIAGNTLKYTDKEAVQGVKYLYTVRGVKGSFLGPYFDQSDDQTKYVCSHATPKVTLSVGVQGEKSGILVKWTVDASAMGYRVFRRAEEETSWREIENIPSGVTVSCFDETVMSGKTYFYAVRSYYGTTPIEDDRIYDTGAWSGYTSSGGSYYLAAPVIVGRENTADGIKITWGMVAGATGYNVYRKSADSGWSRLGMLKGGTAKSFTDENVKDGESWYYTVRACSDEGVSPYITPAEPETFRGPLAVTVENADEGIVLSWQKPDGADWYRVYRKAQGESGWTAIATLNTADADAYTDGQTENGKSYSYAVRAWFAKEGMNGYRAVSLIRVSAPELGEVTSVAEGMQVNWVPVPGAVGYQVWRRTEDGPWTLLKEITGEKSKRYVDTTVTDGTAYRYTVRVRMKLGTQTVLSGGKEPAERSVFHAAPEFQVFNIDEGVQVSWTEAPGAVGYDIYRKRGQETGWTKIARLESDTELLVDKELASGEKGTYAVRAVFADRTMSGYRSVSCTRVSVPVLASELCANQTTGVKVSWLKVNGAASYSVWRKDMSQEDPGWVRVGIVNGGGTTSFVDKTELAAGRRYSYTVVARAADGSGSRFDQTGSSILYLPATQDVIVEAPEKSGTLITWKAVAGASSYQVMRKTDTTQWKKVAQVEGTSWTDAEANKEDSEYIYTVQAVGTMELNGEKRTVYGGYDTAGYTYTFGIRWKGSERNRWVMKDKKQYYVDSRGCCLTGWQYIKRYGTEYKYYFDPDTGELCTNLYQEFGASYADMKCKIITNMSSNSSNRGSTTILLYDSVRKEYNTPAVSVPSVGHMSKTMKGNFYLSRGSGKRWLDSSPGSHEQYAVFIQGSNSWYHTSIYRERSIRNFKYATYNDLANNRNYSGGCIRTQAIYSYLICDIMKNGYGSTARVNVTICRNRTEKPPFGVPAMDGCSSRKTEPTDPAITGLFYYKTKIFGVSAQKGAPNWVYYKNI